MDTNLQQVDYKGKTFDVSFDKTSGLTIESLNTIICVNTGESKYQINAGQAATFTVFPVYIEANSDCTTITLPKTIE